MSQRVKTSARGLVLPRSSSPENGHLRKNNASVRCVAYICIYCSQKKKKKRKKNSEVEPRPRRGVWKHS